MGRETVNGRTHVLFNAYGVGKPRAGKSSVCRAPTISSEYLLFGSIPHSWRVIPLAAISIAGGAGVLAIAAYRVSHGRCPHPSVSHSPDGDDALSLCPKYEEGSWEA